jgi:hypothetical protein
MSTVRLLRITITEIMGVLLCAAAGLATASAAPANGERCEINADHGLRGALEGIMVDGVCRPVTMVQPGSPNVPSRTAGCMADGTAIVDGSPADDSCGPNVPRCMLLVDGGQTSPYPIVAYADQAREPGARAWTVLRFWCPQSTAPVAVPGAADIRDRVIRLLPRVSAATTGPNTLVTIQTL